ncbi:MAG: HAD-IIB family hydrolase [Clostridia bacterium]|nr:HAD-IIB family hydrolase [Clostridia bacterium]
MPRRNIRLIVSDVEGCLVPGGRSPWDLATLARLADYNRRARGRPDLPPLTVCSGRPAQYVEAVCQALHVFVPAICENGGVLLDPLAGRVQPLYDEAGRERMAAVRRSLAEWYAPAGGRLATGKEVCVSLVPGRPAGADIAAFAAEVRERLTGIGLGPDQVVVTYSAGAVDVTPAGIDKGSGLRALLAQLDIGADAVLGIGDGGNDLPLLALVGFRAAPANALPRVRAAVDYLSPHPVCAGVVDIIHRFVPAAAARRPSEG